MRSNINRLFLLLAALLVTEIYARRNQHTICNLNEVGIGMSEVYTVEFDGAKVSGEGDYGTIYAHDCHVLDVSQFDSPWQGGWHTWYGVTSKDYDRAGTFPTEVQTPDGIYNDCTQLDGRRNCDEHGSTYWLSAPVTHCCKFSAPNPLFLKNKLGTSEESQAVPKTY